jgi:ribosomal-protein-alanine N-acetyltransferase
MSSAVQVRAMEGRDLERVVAIADALKDAPHWSRSVYAAALEPATVPQRLCLVAIVEDKSVAGFLVASVVGVQAEIESIAVAPEQQRRGIGRALLAAAMRELSRRGVAEVFLEVRASNQAARTLYRRAGFAECGRRTGYYADPPEDALVLRASFSGP